MNKSCSETIIVLRIIYAGPDAHIFKAAIWFLMIQSVTFTRQAARPTHHRHPAKLAEVLTNTAGLSRLAWTWRQIIEIDLRVAGNKEIKTPIAVIVSPRRTGTPTFACDTKLLSNIRKSSIAIIMIKTRDAEISHVHIRVAIVVVVTHGYTAAPTLVCHAGFVSYIFEFPVAQIVVERSARRPLFPLQGGHRRTIDQVNVGKSIAIIVKDRDTTGSGFKNVILLWAAGTMFEVCQRCLVCYVLKYDRRFGIGNSGCAARGIVHRCSSCNPSA